MPEPDCFLWYRMRCNAEFYYVGEIPRMAPVAAATRGFKMVLFTASSGNNFAWGTCAPPSALLVWLFTCPKSDNSPTFQSKQNSLTFLDFPESGNPGINKHCGRRVRATRYAPPASNHDLWPFDLETGMRVASKVGNLASKFEHAAFGFSNYSLCTRRTDGKSNAHCPLSYGRGRNNLQGRGEYFKIISAHLIWEIAIQLD